MKDITIALIATMSFFVSSAALAVDEYNTATGLTAAGAPLGLHGIDPVAFIDIGNRIEGSARHTAVHDGVAYYFSSEANKAVFEQAPQRYLPQFGGFCTYGVSVAKKFDGNPRFAAIENGKLYVFLNEAIFNEFQKDRKETIKKAQQNWRKIQSTAVKSL